jgi:hypothetical protein
VIQIEKFAPVSAASCGEFLDQHTSVPPNVNRREEAMNIDTRTIVVAAIVVVIAVVAYMLLVPADTMGPETAAPPAATDTAPAASDTAPTESEPAPTTTP